MTAALSIEGRWLTGGTASGPLLVLDEPLSLWGGLDATTGRIIDTQHRCAGESVRGKILAMPGSRGSSGTPGVLGEALRLGVGPLGLVLTRPDFNLVAGTLVAESLYGVSCPIVVVPSEVFGSLVSGQTASLNNFGPTPGEH